MNFLKYFFPRSPIVPIDLTMDRIQTHDIKLFDVGTRVLASKRVPIGTRVIVNQSSGFHKGARGVVKFQEPLGRVWVERDNSGSDMWFYPYELDAE
jgi:hypothetical protein